ncbi:MAG TPA: YihY/virulence factor BrkB family protein [Solirubrobacteraceae bacterium]|jgi:membrane protein|nr:YihY/virulence factor BrkB family protein [Solirubrobacteraceae bacterium]
MTAIPASRDDLREVAENVVEAFRRDRLMTAAAAIAYQVLSAVIPLALFALALFGVLHLSSLWSQHIGPWIAGRTSVALYTVINDTVTQVLLHKEVFWLTAGLALTMWELSSAVRAVMEALDRIYEAHRRRPWRRRMLVSIALGAGAGALLLAAFVVLALGGVVTGTGAVSFAWRMPLAALLFGATIWVVGRWAPSKRRPVKWVSFGSAVTIVTWLVTAAGYGVWVTQISQVGSAFGSLAAVFVFIVFTYVSSVVYLAGAVVDASVREEATGGEA